MGVFCKSFESHLKAVNSILPNFFLLKGEGVRVDRRVCCHTGSLPGTVSVRRTALCRSAGKPGGFGQEDKGQGAGGTENPSFPAHFKALLILHLKSLVFRSSFSRSVNGL